MANAPDRNNARRREAMAVLAHSATEQIANCLSALDVPAHEPLREPEPGLVVLRGRVGGDGAPFNLGEATVSRAAVRLVTGEVGFGYALGRDCEKARLMAICDALLQSERLASRVEEKLVAPLRFAMVAERGRKAAHAAATKVDFYTMVRGEG